MATATNGGGGPSFDEFFHGIAQQESGGNYGAVNPGSGALGKYQIMPGNIAEWSQKYMGTQWTPQQFLGDPYKQEALAKAVLGDYYTKWGARGAASAWYSGDPALNLNYNPQKGGPPIGQYVDEVIGKSMGFPGTPGTSYQSAAAVPVTTVDNTVKPVAKPQMPGSAGVGAVSAPGIDAFTSSGAGAVGTNGGQAFGEAPTSAPTPTAGTIPPPPTTGPTGAATGAQGQAIAAGQKWLGTPYVFGGGNSGGPSKSPLAHGNFNDVGFDCSGFIQYALAGAGISAPRLSYDQLQMGQRVPLNQLKPGDLVGFGDGGHIALYEGNGQIIEAAKTGTPVRERALGPNEGAWGVSISGLYK
jgi:cell wall-associated NlpC family hydrolase